VQGQQQVQQLAAAHADVLSHTAACPSPFLEHAIAAFDRELPTLRATANELAALAPASPAAPRAHATLAALPAVLRTLHEYFITVAAGVARLRDAVSAVRRAHLAERAAAGDYYDPFADAERREAAAASTAAVLAGALGGTVGAGWRRGAGAPPLALPAPS
jgi:hypothetical protein